MKKPPLPNLSAQEGEDLIKKIEAQCQQSLQPEDISLLTALIRSYTYLQWCVKEAKIGWKKLCRYFGLIPRPRANGKQIDNQLKDLLEDSDNDDDPASGDPEASTEKTSPEHPKKTQKRSGYGRKSHDKYVNAKEIYYAHPFLKVGDTCPDHCGGRVYSLKPGVFVELRGHPLVTAVKHLTERLRCSGCLKIFSANRPAGLRKCDPALTAQLALQKYGAGMPFYRQTALQRQQSIELSASSQYHYINTLLYPVLKLVTDVLKKQAAEGSLVYFDDTPMRILEVMKELDSLATSDLQKKRKGTYATGIYSIQQHPIVLYLVGKNHSGENILDLLKQRQSPYPLIAMSDAKSDNNIPQKEENQQELGNISIIWCRCLAHARQHFADLLGDCPTECGVVLKSIRRLYKNDTYTKHHNMTLEQRLDYHKEHSVSILTDLKAYLTKLFEDKVVEPNSHLGKAIKYMQNHWEGLVQFTKVAGAPLDNNEIERLLKRVIVLRKNAYFLKTLYSSSLAGDIMSVIVTCQENRVSAYEYLVALQQHERDVRQHPD